LTTFAPLFVPVAAREAVSDRAWLRAMLAFEQALANATARAGVIPAESAAAIAGSCRVELYDIDQLCEQGRKVGAPAEPLVRALRAQVGGDAAHDVHHGATSQDVLDTAAMLVARNARAVIEAELDGAAGACARLADEYRSTPMAARTLLQQAVPTTFGLKAAGWLLAVADARESLRRVRLPVQLGGAAGTLAALGDHGPEVLSLLAAELGLDEPVLPWHIHRGPVTRLAAALTGAATACAKIGLDVVLLAQTEVGEVAEPAGGGSSTMPQKNNPVRSTLARACARGVHANVAVLTGGEHELERAAGAWHAEWTALSEALALTAGAAGAMRECLEGLRVFPERMRANLSPALTAERVAFALAARVGREQAHALAADAFASDDPRAALAAHVEQDELDDLLDPTRYLGSATVLVDRALAAYRGTA
jgi:3-carboxy-cis,cis-muconate cycloisomerase